MAVDYEVKFSHTGIDFEELKRTSVDGDITLPSRGREVNFQEHICMLEKEFCGRSELELYVIWLTVKIRRGIDLKKSVNSFFQHGKMRRSFC